MPALIQLLQIQYGKFTAVLFSRQSTHIAMYRCKHLLLLELHFIIRFWDTKRRRITTVDFDKL